MRIHFISIGGAVMHNLALALQDKGFTVTGSDDEIFEPSRSRLLARGLLPASLGWDPSRIRPDLDAVVLGMHARTDNPELLRAQELGLRIYSFPEFLFEQTRHKLRVVVGGSHGKTTITAMIIHVLKHAGIPFDYMVGAQLEGFETMVGLSDEAKVAVFEGDEYLSSAIDRRPKFHLYQPQVGLISGIAWDHMNVFPTFEVYREQFAGFAEVLEPGGLLIYNQEEDAVQELVNSIQRTDITKTGYSTHPYTVHDGRFWILANGSQIPLSIFGRHNMQNLAAAYAVCSRLGVAKAVFYDAIAHYRGAARRLQLLKSGATANLYYDFAHAPSKVRATTEAVRELFPNRGLVACLELHTFSSLNAMFLTEYRGSLSSADIGIVYFDPHTVEHKRLERLEPHKVVEAFAQPALQVFTDRERLLQYLGRLDWHERNLLMMSSGTFSGLDFQLLIHELGL